MRALRFHQWPKNLLVFVPLVTSRLVLSSNAVARAAAAFFCFSLCAGSGYIFNDLLDVPQDRKHRQKRARPFAAGELSPKEGLALSALLLAASTVMAYEAISASFASSLLLYFALVVLYSLGLKRVPLIDVMMLAGFYALRLIAGSLSVGVPASLGLISFALFFFMSLACLKRYSQLRLRSSRDEAPGAYAAGDLDKLSGLGAASGLIAGLLGALYIESPQAAALYSHPGRLWLICPLMLYWLSRLWLLARRGRIGEDPLPFVFKDGVTRLIGLGAAIAVWAAF